VEGTAESSPARTPGGAPRALGASLVAGALAVALAAVLHAGRWVLAGIALGALLVVAIAVIVVLRSLADRDGRLDGERQDQLTGLPTVAQLRIDLGRWLERAGGSRPATLVLLTLENLKKYNDSYGHACGDALIAWLARKLTDAVGGRARVYRLRGGEFALVIEAAQHVIEEVITAADVALSEIGDGFLIWSSYGSVGLPGEADSVGEALKLADRRAHAYRSRPYAGPAAADAGEVPDDPLEVLRFARPRYDVAELAVAVGRRMGLQGAGLEQLEVGAQLRDVGNMAIPAAVLGHPGELSEAEWRFVRLHTLVGERLLAANFDMEEVAALVRSSHERWDGAGYPDGLSGEAIPLGSRIVFVCSAFQDMTSVRSHRGALSAQEALGELEAGARSQFDPRVVEAFREAFHSASGRTLAGAPESAARLRVLVAEDDAAARFLLSRAIEESGHQVLCAEDGAQAWELFRRHRPEVVVSDWLMPRVDGDELCRRIRADIDAPYTYFVMLTALEYKGHVLRGMQAGVDDFLTKPLDRHELKMRLIAAERVSALHRRLREQQQAIQAEVELAATVQRGLLPAAAPRVPGVQLEGVCIPAANVGGDYFDYLVDGDDRVTLIVADVAGHNISSALLMAGARAIVRREVSEARGPAHLLSLVNQTMFAELVSAELFITAFCARYDPAQRSLVFANAGHNPPLVRRAADGTVETLEPEGAAIGILEDGDYDEASALLQPGDVVLLYTDGVIEAADSEQREFGEARLRELLRRRGGGSAAELLEQVLGEIRAHTGEEPQRDDITMLAMRVQ
jgi:diguanylate cyclase (GGDEF)-like protein